MAIRVRPLLVASTAAALLSAAGCGGSSPASVSTGGTQPQATHAASGKNVTVLLTGHIATSQKSVYKNGGTVQQAQNLDWTVQVSGSLADVTNGTAVPQVTMISGHVAWSGTGGAPCQGDLVKNPQQSQGDLQGLLTVEAPGNPNPAMNSGSGVGPPNTQGMSDYLVEATVPTKAFVSTDTNPSDSQCNTPVIGGLLLTGPPQSAPQYKEWQHALAPFATFDSSGNSKDYSFNTSWAGQVPSGENAAGTTVTGTAQASENFSWH